MTAYTFKRKIEITFKEGDVIEDEGSNAAYSAKIARMNTENYFS